jgi:hypothetical protein
MGGALTALQITAGTKRLGHAPQGVSMCISIPREHSAMKTQEQPDEQPA